MENMKILLTPQMMVAWENWEEANMVACRLACDLVAEGLSQSDSSWVTLESLAIKASAAFAEFARLVKAEFPRIDVNPCDQVEDGCLVQVTVRQRRRKIKA